MLFREFAQFVGPGGRGKEGRREEGKKEKGKGERGREGKGRVRNGDGVLVFGGQTRREGCWGRTGMSLGMIFFDCWGDR